MVSAQTIQALPDTTAAVNGLTVGTTSSLASNDNLNRTLLVIGTTPGDVILSVFILNANGRVTIAPNTAAFTCSLTFKICDVNNPTNCSSVTTIIVVTPQVTATDLSPNITIFQNTMHGTTNLKLQLRLVNYWEPRQTAVKCW